MPSPAIAALLQNTIGTPATWSVTVLDRAGPGVDPQQPLLRVAHQEPAVEVDLEAERAAAGVGDLVDPAPVVGHPPERAVRGAR